MLRMYIHAIYQLTIYQLTYLACNNMNVFSLDKRILSRQIFQIYFHNNLILTEHAFTFSAAGICSECSRGTFRPAELILISLYYRGRNAAARHRHVTLSRTLVRSPLSLLHPSVHPGSEDGNAREPTCPIPSAIRVTATFIRGTTDGSASRPVHVLYVHVGSPSSSESSLRRRARDFFRRLLATLPFLVSFAISAIKRSPGQYDSYWYEARVLQFFFFF